MNSGSSEETILVPTGSTVHLHVLPPPVLWAAVLCWSTDTIQTFTMEDVFDALWPFVFEQFSGRALESLVPSYVAWSETSEGKTAQCELDG